MKIYACIMCCYVLMSSLNKDVLKINSIYVFLVTTLFLAQVRFSRSDYLLKTGACQ